MALSIFLQIFLSDIALIKTLFCRHPKILNRDLTFLWIAIDLSMLIWISTKGRGQYSLPLVFDRSQRRPCTEALLGVFVYQLTFIRRGRSKQINKYFTMFFEPNAINFFGRISELNYRESFYSVSFLFPLFLCSDYLQNFYRNSFCFVITFLGFTKYHENITHSWQSYYLGWHRLPHLPSILL